MTNKQALDKMVLWSGRFLKHLVFSQDHIAYSKTNRSERFGEQKKKKKFGWRCSLSALFTEQVPKIQIMHHFVFVQTEMTPRVCVKTEIV